MTKLSELFLTARDALAEKRWARGALARLSNGMPFPDASSPRVVAVCAVGALELAEHQLGYSSDNLSLRGEQFINDRRWDLGIHGYELTSFNDRTARRKQDVMDLFDRAAKLAKDLDL